MFEVVLDIQFSDTTGGNTHVMMIDALPPIGSTMFIPYKDEHRETDIDGQILSYHVIGHRDHAMGKKYRGKIMIYVHVVSEERKDLDKLPAGEEKAKPTQADLDNDEAKWNDLSGTTPP